MTPVIRRRHSRCAERLSADLHPVLRRVYAARGITDDSQLPLSLKNLLPPAFLGIEQAVSILTRAIDRHDRIVVAGDFDADGATASALAVLGLRALGATAVEYIVPNRFTMGYGLSPALAAQAVEAGAQVLITVDNGISSEAGVRAAKDAGLTVVITDHHLAPVRLPNADAIVNPNQPGCSFASKNLAGVGVMFYLLGALRAGLRVRQTCPSAAMPNLADYLDLVALGTIADLVRLDRNNRILVEQGLQRIRHGRCRAGIRALLESAGRTTEYATASDLAFSVAPRLNAAGRLDDMRLGIECLLASDLEQARSLATQLNNLNRERREIEQQMREQALVNLPEIATGTGICVFNTQWHEGVVGLVAARLREQLHRPTIAFAPSKELGVLKGSGRSIPGFHLRDALAEIDAGQPHLIDKFGGHAMASGLSLRMEHLESFRAAFDSICRAQLDDDSLRAVIETDGELSRDEMDLHTALALESGGPWGQGFPEPIFDGTFTVLEARIVGAERDHARYRFVSPNGTVISGIHFWGAESARTSGNVRLAYRLIVNRYGGQQTMEIQIEHMGS